MSIGEVVFSVSIIDLRIVSRFIVCIFGFGVTPKARANFFLSLVGAVSNPCTCSTAIPLKSVDKGIFDFLKQLGQKGSFPFSTRFPLNSFPQIAHSFFANNPIGISPYARKFLFRPFVIMAQVKMIDVLDCQARRMEGYASICGCKENLKARTR
jgi:hypothetical protein